MVPLYSAVDLLPVVLLLAALFISSHLMCLNSSPHPPFPRSLGHQHPRFVAIVEALYQRSDDGAIGRPHMLTSYGQFDDYCWDHLSPLSIHKGKSLPRQHISTGDLRLQHAQQPGVDLPACPLRVQFVESFPLAPEEFLHIGPEYRGIDP